MEKTSKISKNVEIIDLCVYLKNENSLVLADLHLGLEETMNKDGVFIPRMNFNEIKNRLENKVFKKFKKFDKIIINGDLKHEFGKPSKQEWFEVLDMLRFLKKNCDEILLIKGNHDHILGPIAKFEGIEILGELYFPSEKIIILHGHKLSESENFKNAKTLVIAHDHPAVTLCDTTKKETFKCFLKGKFLKKTLIVQPSLNQLSHGTNVSREKLLSPFLQNDLNNFEIWVVEDKVYYFGKLGELK